MNYPFHMPGHKRNPAFLEETDVALLAGGAHPLYGAYLIDTTETPATDDLHHPAGMLKKAQERAGALYREAVCKRYGDEALLSDAETFYLVGGATSGVLAAIGAVSGAGGRILVARNAHRSLYHALYLHRAEPVYVMPERAVGKEGPLPFSGVLSPERVARILSEEKDIRAVFCTSPTYEGIVSPVSKIADIAHDYGIPLIVDEAHGAHFSLDEDLPESALFAGADIVIHSLHKTLASLTQTALLHVRGTLADRERVRRFLSVHQSSSPSYVLMASIDAAINDLTEHGRERFDTLRHLRGAVEAQAAGWKTMRLVEGDIAEDPCKITITARAADEIAGMLREEYGIETEMADASHLVCILTPYDTAEGVGQLLDALEDIDRRREETLPEEEQTDDDFPFPQTLPAFAMSLHEAWDGKTETVALSAAKGRISADFIYAYPPGIPLIVPGEVFDEGIISVINKKNNGLRLHGVTQNGEVRVLAI